MSMLERFMYSLDTPPDGEYVYQPVTRFEYVTLIFVTLSIVVISAVGFLWLV